jgi:hypothetical protein
VDSLFSSAGAITMGDNNALIVQIILGLLVIFFFVTVFFSTRTWRFPHVAFFVLCFFGSAVFVVFAAMTLKTHKNWRTEVNRMAKDLETQTAIKEQLQHGEITAVQQEANLRSVRAEIGRILLDRGRVWRGTQPGNFDGTSVTVQTAAAGAPGGPAGAEPEPEKTIVYAFKEFPNADNTLFLPSLYLGEFAATVSGGTIVLTPTLPLDAVQRQQIAINDATWALYEVLPIDGHEFFAGLSDAELRALIPQGNLPAEVYDDLITSYLRTGGPATDDDPPEHRWVKVKFLRKKSVDVDNEQMQIAEVNFFDQQGRAVAARLRRGEAVEFDLGQTAVVDQETAEQWAAAGDVEKQEFIYVRPLNDYAKMFHYFHNQRVYLADQIARVTKETDSINKSTQLAEGQVATLMDETTKLESDLANFKLEQAAVGELEQALTAQMDDLRKQLSETFRLNQQLATELAALQRQLAEEIHKADTNQTAALAP